MNTNLYSLTFSLLAATLATLLPGAAAAQTEPEEIALVRNLIKADRQAVVVDALQLTDAESQMFWPIYRQYRAEMDKVGDGLVKLMQDYARLYPDVPDDRAKPMLEEYTNLEKKKQATRVKYLKKFGKVLPSGKNLRFAQVENRLDLAVQLRLAVSVPLVPIEGRIGGNVVAGALAAEGVAGGAVVQTFELTATVVAIHQASRKVTLLSADGIKETVNVGPEAINFDQIRVGDRVKFETTQELVVGVAEPGETRSDAAAQVVALAPKGAKPGAVLAEVTQVSATITGLDKENRTASLRFEDGATRTLAVRPDVDLNKYKVGDKVVFSLTEMVAISVSKP